MRVCAYISNGINAGSANCVCMQIFETAKHLRRKLRRINNVYMSVSVVHKSRSVGVVGVDVACLVRHRSEYQVWKLFLLLLSQYMHPTGDPNAYEVIYELTACQSVLLKEQFDDSLALLLDLLVSFARTFCLFLMNTHVKSAV